MIRAASLGISLSGESGLSSILAFAHESGAWPLQPSLHDQVNIVLHRLGPVVHEVLIHIVGVEQRGLPKGFQQIFGERFDQRLGMVADRDAFQMRGVGLLPFREQRRSPIG